MLAETSEFTMEYVWIVISNPAYRNWWAAFATTLFALSAAYYYVLIKPLRKEIIDNRSKSEQEFIKAFGNVEEIKNGESALQKILHPVTHESEPLHETEQRETWESSPDTPPQNAVVASQPKRAVRDRDARELLAEIHSNPNRFLSRDELEAERESRRQQLGQIFRTMRGAPEKFGECSIEEIRDQLNLYL